MLNNEYEIKAEKMFKCLNIKFHQTLRATIAGLIDIPAENENR